MTALELALLDAGLRGVLVALLAVLAVAIGVTRHRRLPHRVVGLALAIGLAVQAVVNAPVVESAFSLGWRSPGIGISVGNAVLFWLFVRSLVDDDFRLRPRHVAIWLGVVVATALNCSFLLRSPPPVGRVAADAQQALPLVFALLAAFAALRHWSADLVEKRRRLRAFVVVAGIGYAVVVIAARAASPDGRLTAGRATLDVALLLGIVAVVATRLLRLGAVDPFATTVEPAFATAMPDGADFAAWSTGAATAAPSSGVSTSPLPIGVGAGPLPTGVGMGPLPTGVAVESLHTGVGTGTLPTGIGTVPVPTGLRPTTAPTGPGTPVWPAEAPTRSAPGWPAVPAAHAPDADGPVSPTSAVADPADDRLAAALDRAMREERAYRVEDLTVASLAARLGAPEYRLRRVINQRLGHRNFNAFVNGFRLAEAKQALADPAKRERPILSIALDAGFQSIGPFNRAFKADTGMTPGDFRREHLADS